MGETVIEAQRSDDRQAVLVVAGEVDLSWVQPIWDAAVESLSRKPQRLVIDVSEVTFITSSVLGALMRIHAAAKEQGTSVVLRHPTPIVQRLLRLSRLDAVLPVEP